MLKSFLGASLSVALASVAACAQQPQPQPQSAQAAPPAQQQQQPPPAPPKTHLKVGDLAPDFALRDTEGKEVKLSDFRGKKNVVLAFYVLAFTGG